MRTEWSVFKYRELRNVSFIFIEIYRNNNINIKYCYFYSIILYIKYIRVVPILVMESMVNVQSTGYDIVSS